MYETSGSKKLQILLTCRIQKLNKKCYGKWKKENMMVLWGIVV